MKNIIKPLLAAGMAVSIAGCTVGGSAAATSAKKSDDDTYTVGIIQLVQHPALDAATKGFEDALKDEFGDKVTIEYKNASGNSTDCVTIANQFVSDNVDLIMANATPALQAASSATTTIPVLGTSVTDYGTALDIDFKGTIGTNVSGTTDLAPLDQQADMFKELLPDARKIGILYCNAEPNSKYQADIVEKDLQDLGYEVTRYKFTDSNDVQQVTQTACNECDALYVPTDNTAANAAETINNVALPAKTPIITGEEGIMAGCGIATLSIDYYNLGKKTGEMAIKILKGEEKVEDMPVESDDNPVKEYDKDRCEQLGITVPDDYKAYEPADE